jgi:glucose/arabinose dehydrogenase
LFLSSCAGYGGSNVAQAPTAPAATPSPGVDATTDTTSLPASSLPGVKLPAGFQISIYAKGLHTPRFMTIGPNGVLLVADRASSSVIALLPGSSPMTAEKSQTLVNGLHEPTSLYLHDGYLYIGERTSIARVKLGNDLKAGPIERIITDIPAGNDHTTRTVVVGPDNHIYVAIGSDCNLCQETDPRLASVRVYNLDGSNGKEFAKGLRNAVGLAINPWNKQLWATNNGRDLLGDNVPPETVYNLVDQGDYGWPRCHAGDIVDPQFGQGTNACQGVQQPLVKMQAHSAPLGLAFYTDTMKQFPEQYRNSLYVAFHGSWNRTTPTGYKVVRVPLKDGKVAGPAEDFATGWLSKSNAVTGRPVDVKVAPDGSLFVSDDTFNVIYHIWYRG